LRRGKHAVAQKFLQSREAIFPLIFRDVSLAYELFRNNGIQPQPQSTAAVRTVFMNDETQIDRKRMVELLNEDLAREYQAIIAYIIYSQTLKGAEYNHIAQELEKHAGEELQHAIKIAKQIDYFNGEPVNKPKEVKVSDKPKEMLQFDLENERQTIINYRERIRQADTMGEFALGEVLREIIAQEQEHLQDLADALGIDTPKIEG
jgi:bacterioferritin